MTQRDAKETALSFYINTFEANHKQYLSIIASADYKDVRREYLQLFQWTPSVLESLRILTDKLFFKGESQHIDTILQDFADSWFEQYKDNNLINFGNSNGVYLISYSLILLNTDVHTSDGQRKHISKFDYVRNTLDALSSNNIPLSDKQDINSELSKYYDQLLNDELKLVNSGSKKTSDGDNSSLHSSNSSLVSPTLSSPPMRSFGFANLLLNERTLKKQPSRESLGSSHTTSQASSFTLKTGISMSHLSNLNEMDDESEEEESLLIIVEEEGDLELELDGPPWIKEGLLNVIMVDDDSESASKQQGKLNFLKSKPINPFAKWRSGFAVVSKGELRLFSFENSPVSTATQQQQQKVKGKRSIMGLGFSSSSTLASKSNGQAYGSTLSQNEPVGGGNWYDTANCIGSFNLSQTYASKPTEQTLVSLRLARSTPAKNLGHVYWSLTLPLQNTNCKKHTKLVFQCGSNEIAREFIETCNFWAARSSNVPNENTTVSSYEYGWSKNLTLLIDAINVDKKDTETIKQLNALKVTDWSPLLTSNLPTNLVMKEQLQKLKSYHTSLKAQLEEHQLIKPKIDSLHKILKEIKLSSRQVQPTQSSFSLRRRNTEPVGTNELTINIRLILNNYNKKLNYLNRELLKYKKYLNSLTNAIKLRKEKLEEEFSSSDGDAEPFKSGNDIFGDDEFGAGRKIIMIGSD